MQRPGRETLRRSSSERKLRTRSRTRPTWRPAWFPSAPAPTGLLHGFGSALLMFTLLSLAGCCSEPPRVIIPLEIPAGKPPDRTGAILELETSWTDSPEGTTTLPTTDLELILRDRGSWKVWAEVLEDVIK